MAKTPILKPREVESLIESLGFVQVRPRGSHCQYRHPDERGTTIPFQGNRDISPILLHEITKDIGLTLEEFVSRRR
ncbi:MAG TPA: type II toxin-antitoxin system HicA family toxin [Candidatus Hydrogenedentes bacterium]|nr:type II toxin-antitoxin system HicA family toxin [Candidatus Hydrogenedentota bacterium]HPC16229.1 type II toxin-antitoxin system HicA family toxin [Candidatus Hydrogenedentota bacterium]HRT18559.1 type II toxin-antitoxin system HicA family toxin [Candidatus Hydrogenedentota bacterium]HRT63578.1 type II toxin-antitoxin system HicA family toxin [Candidatus Hydrogenedentota bacterium]